MAIQWRTGRGYVGPLWVFDLTERDGSHWLYANQEFANAFRDAAGTVAWKHATRESGETEAERVWRELFVALARASTPAGSEADDARIRKLIAEREGNSQTRKPTRRGDER
jgi:hypothetical protein